MGCCSSRIMFTKEIERLDKDAQNNITEEIEKKEVNEPKIEYRNKINVTYSLKPGKYCDLLGYEFMTKNKDNVELILNGVQIKQGIKLKEGENILTIIIKNKLEDLSYMFHNCRVLKDITELQYLEVSEVKSFDFMF